MVLTSKFYKLAAASVLCLIMSLTLGCNNKATKESGEQKDTANLVIGVLPTYGCLPFYVADSLGLFDSLGVTVRLETFNSSMDCDTAFLRHHLNGCATDLVKAHIWKNNKEKFKVISALNSTVYLMTARQARIIKSESLKEKIIAITRNSMLDFTLDNIIASVKLQSEQVNKPQINNICIRKDMLEQNQYDGAILPEPYASIAQQKGAVRIDSSEKFGYDLGVILMSDTTISKQRNDVLAFMNAYNSAIDFINEKINSNNMAQLLSFLPISNYAVNDTTAYLKIKQMKYASSPSDNSVKATRDWTVRRRLVSSSYSADGIIDDSFVNQQRKNKK